MSTPGDDATRLLFLLAQAAGGGVTGAAGMGVEYWTKWTPERINATVEALRAKGFVDVRQLPVAPPYNFNTVSINGIGLEAMEEAVQAMRDAEQQETDRVG